MYSIVLLAAMSAAPENPALFGLIRSRRAACACACSCYVGCHGCYGCFGCYGCGCYAIPYGCGCFAPAPACWGVYSVGYACGCGFPVMASPVVPAITTPPPPTGGGEVIPDKPKIVPPGGEASLNKARMTVEVPEGAKLYIDDRLMKTTSSRRNFTTPDLEPGQMYYYILRAEISHNGQAYSETKRVIVRAGDRIQASFADLEARAARQAEATARR